MMNTAATQTEEIRRKRLDNEVKWYVLRDLRRANAKSRAYQLLLRNKIEVFTPMKWERGKGEGRRAIVETPVIPDLLIAHSSVSRLAKYVTAENRLQYRYLRGGWLRKMTVDDAEMRRFMQAMSAGSYVDYYSPEDFNPGRIGETITIRGGAFDGQEGILLRVDGAKRKSLVVRLSNLFVAVVELKDQADGTAARG